MKAVQSSYTMDELMGHDQDNAKTCRSHLPFSHETMYILSRAVGTSVSCVLHCVLYSSLFFSLFFLPGCVRNSSSREQSVNPPIILGIGIEGSGHLIRVAAQNAELGFTGYRLYTGATAAAAQSAALNSGLECGPFATLPNLSLEYFIEVKPNQTAVIPTNANDRLCLIVASLNPGDWIALRAVTFKDLTSVGSSIISNASQVP